MTKFAVLKIEQERRELVFIGAHIDSTIQQEIVVKRLTPSLKVIATEPRPLPIFKETSQMRAPKWEPTEARDVQRNNRGSLLFECEVPLSTWRILKRGNYEGLYNMQLSPGHTYLLQNPGSATSCADWSILAIDIEVCGTDGAFPDADMDPILQISMVFQPRGHTRSSAVVISISDTAFTVVKARFTMISVLTEARIIKKFTQLTRELDPDIITGWNVLNFDMLYIHRRARICDVSLNIGRDGSQVRTWEKTVHTRAHGTRITNMFNAYGRIIFDALATFQKIINEPTYKLGAVATKHLGTGKENMPYSEIPLAMKTHEGRLRVASYCATDSRLVLQLISHFKLMQRFSGIHSVTGVPLNKIIHGGQQIRCFSALMKEVYEENLPFAFHMKNDFVEEGSYQGATVITPRIGPTKDVIATLDFAALYPNIIRAYNMCWSTLITDLVLIPAYEARRCPYHDVETHAGHSVRRILSIDGKVHMGTMGHVGFIQDEEGLIPRVQTKLYKRRKDVKRQMKSTEGRQREILDAYQLALKLVMNSMYGLLGAKQGYMPEKRIASAITCTGRMLIEWSRLCAENKPELTVVGGDTDSIFIHAPHDTCDSIITYHKYWDTLAREITATYGHPALVLEYEKMYKGEPQCFSWVLVAKKRYAGYKWDAWATEGKLVYTGLECKRRDFCEHLHRIMKELLLALFTVPNTTEIFHHMQKQIIHIFDHSAEMLSDFTLSRQYFKKAEDYANAKSLPHVKIAMRTKANVGARIQFLIADLGGQSMADRAVTHAEFATHNSHIDTMYYFHKQFSKPLRRISDVVDSQLSEQTWSDTTRMIKKIHAKRRKSRQKQAFNQLFRMYK